MTRRSSSFLNPSGISQLYGIQPYNPMDGFRTALPENLPEFDLGSAPMNEVPVYAGGDTGSWWDGANKFLFGSKDTQTGIQSNGAAGSILGVAQGFGNAYMGMQQFGLAKKALAQSKEQFERNYAAQRTTTNASLEDRQRARVASNAGAYQSVGEYMAKNGVR